jgi:trans-L-3-hydroxyproline dehydratase
MIRVIKTIDAHVGGQPLRLVVDGLPRSHGKTPAQQREWYLKHADAYRRALVLAPRGHADMTAAITTDPSTLHANTGVVFMDAGGYPSMSGHAVIAVTTIAFERRLALAHPPGNGEERLAFDTPAGSVQARARIEMHAGVRSVDSVALTNVPAFVHAAAVPVVVGRRDLRVDVAFGGAFYAIVDSEATGVPLDSTRLPDLRRLGAEISASLNAARRPVHPMDDAIDGVAGVIFTGPASDPEAHLRNVTVRASGSIDRSPGGTGTSAVMAVLDAMGLLPDHQAFVHESLSGALFRGRPLHRTVVADYPALVTEIEGSAWITGEHTFFLDDDDPFRDGGSF